MHSHCRSNPSTSIPPNRNLRRGRAAVGVTVACFAVRLVDGHVLQRHQWTGVPGGPRSHPPQLLVTARGVVAGFLGINEADQAHAVDIQMIDVLENVVERRFSRIVIARERQL